MRMIRGEMPESVIIYTMGMEFDPNHPSPTKMIGPFVGGPGFGFGPTPGGDPTVGRVDDFGVQYVANAETGFGQLPKPGDYILKDIRDWKKVLKLPEFPTVSSWQDMAKQNEDMAKIDRTKNAAVGACMFSPFQQLMALMGFTEGLAAMYEEPEEALEMFNWMADHYVKYSEALAAYYDIDILGMADDSATRYNPFVSVKMYDDLLKPIYARLTKPLWDKGIPAEFHNCGRCEDYVPSMRDYGVRAWDPAQTSNDLLAIKTKYKDFAVMGGFDFQIPATWPVVTEEEVREQVRATFAKYAPGGGYGFCGNILMPANDPNNMTYNGWLMDEAYTLADEYYLKH
jgi:hypothetical protein